MITNALACNLGIPRLHALGFLCDFPTTRKENGFHVLHNDDAGTNVNDVASQNVRPLFKNC